MAEEEEKIASTSATKEEKVEASLEEEVEVVDSEGLDDSEEDKEPRGCTGLYRAEGMVCI